MGLPFGIPIQEAYDLVRAKDGITEENDHLTARIQGLDFSVNLREKDWLYGIGTDGVYMGLVLTHRVRNEKPSESDYQYILNKYSQDIRKIYDMLSDAFGETDYECLYAYDYVSDYNGYFDIPYKDAFVDMEKLLETGIKNVSFYYYWNNIYMTANYFNLDSAGITTEIGIYAQDIIYKKTIKNIKEHQFGDFFEYLKKKDIGITSFK